VGGGTCCATKAAAQLQRAVFCFVLIMLVAFFAIGFLKSECRPLPTPTSDEVMLIQQLAMFACPAP